MTIAAIEAAVAESGAGDIRPPGGSGVPPEGDRTVTRGGRNAPVDRRPPRPAERRSEPAARLAGRSPSAGDAAVALVFAGSDADLRLCFIRRATHPRDPWSGQMALPGGRAAPGDASLCAAAVRETREEVGLALARARYLGALPPIPMVRAGRPIDGSVAPFAFSLEGEPPVLTVDPGEVAAAYWIAVRHLCDPDQRAELRLTRGGVTRRLPAVRFGRHLIWGMTYRIVTDLLERATRESRPNRADAS